MSKTLERPTKRSEVCSTNKSEGDDAGLPAFLDRRAGAALIQTSNAMRISPVGLEISESLSFKEWEELGRQLQFVERSLMWAIGDWLRFGERKWGEKYTQAIETSEYNYQTIRNAQWVARRIDLSRRRDKLSWSHHAEVAALAPNLADKLLSEAETQGWSQKELRAAVSRAKAGAKLQSVTGIGGKISDLHAFATSGQKVATVYADPPWLYDNQGTRAATRNHYQSLTVEQLCELPVIDFVAENAHLHLWTTNAFLFECPRIFEAWGFEFRSSFIWTKPQLGIGNYWRNSHEFLLTAIRGDAKSFADHTLKSWLECDRGAHSAKPEQVRHYIKRASPGPHLELFARRTSPGWFVWGDQIEPHLFDTPELAVA